MKPVTLNEYPAVFANFTKPIIQDSELLLVDCHMSYIVYLSLPNSLKVNQNLRHAGLYRRIKKDEN